MRAVCTSKTQESQHTVSDLLRRAFGRSAIWYVFLLPALIPFGAFVLIPFAYAFALTFQTGDLLSPMVFVGLGNYRGVLSDKLFWKALLNTSKYVAMGNPLALSTSLVLALLLRQRIKLRGLIQAILFIPWLVPMPIVAIMWNFLLYPDYGIVNYLIGLVGIPPQIWLGSETLALPTLVAIDLWRGTGFYVMIWYAALMGIPDDMYEFATLEGGNALQKLHYITLPLLKPTGVFLLVVSIIWAFQVFDSVYVLTHGGPNKATFTSVYYIYRYTFKAGDVGYAATMSFALMVVVFVLSMIVLRQVRSTVEY